MLKMFFVCCFFTSGRNPCTWLGYWFCTGKKFRFVSPPRPNFFVDVIILSLKLSFESFLNVSLLLKPRPLRRTCKGKVCFTLPSSVPLASEDQEVFPPSCPGKLSVQHVPTVLQVCISHARKTVLHKSLKFSTEGVARAHMVRNVTSPTPLPCGRVLGLLQVRESSSAELLGEAPLGRSGVAS